MRYICFSHLLAVDSIDYVQLLSAWNVESTVEDYIRENTGSKPLAARSLKQNKSQEPRETQQAGFSLAESRIKRDSERLLLSLDSAPEKVPQESVPEHNLKDEEAESNKDEQV